MVSKAARRIINSTKSRPIKVPSTTPLGAPGYDNPREDIEKTKDLREGSVARTPTDDLDIANKKYVDDNSGGTWNDTSTNTGTNKTFNDFSNFIDADGIHELLRNESGGAMTVGDAVFISGYSVGQERALVSLADSSVAGTMPSIAILEEATLANNASGHFIEVGTVKDMDTDSWNVGDDLYISETGTTTNTLTNVKPTGAALVQKVAVVLRKHASLGIIEVFGAGRSNDLPNIASNNFWLGNGSGVPIANNFDTEVSANSDVTTNTAKTSFSKTEIKGVINHGSTASTARPTGFDSVEWIGTVEPTNANNDDTWIDTT